MLAVIGEAVAMFAATNIDDIVLLTVFFGRAVGDPAKERRVVIGQYLGFGGILALSVIAAAGLQLLPDDATAYLGLIPIAIGIRAAVVAWRNRRSEDEVVAPAALGTGAVAAITFANGGDNVGVYVPAFTAAGLGDMAVYVGVFVVLIGLWLAVGRAIASRPTVARALSRWGHVVLPVVLIAIGLIILVDGGAFGL